MDRKQSSFQTPITIFDTIGNVHSKNYLLPAIQREFVWKPEQIIKLFDSLLRGYPIGSFLFWNLEREKIRDFQFYEFIRNYHERDNKHNPKAHVADINNLLVILDGQQRLTGLYIALMGTYAYKMPWKQWKNNDAFPVKKLFLNLLSKSEDVDMHYDLAFLTAEESNRKDDNKYWFRVGDILSINEESDVNDYLVENGLMSLEKNISKFANKTLFRLHSTIHKDRAINYYLEQSQELDKVLNIFIRVNSGGTQLSYSDLLLSIATAQWKNKDAREEVNNFVDEINSIGEGFEFDKDFVLKSCLVLLDFSDIAFKVDNFSNQNMEAIEKEWESIKKSIRLSVDLISSFGYSQHTLTSSNAIIPIAYYIMKLGNPSMFVQSTKYYEDRLLIKKWFAMSLIKRLFSGQPDNVLRPIRTVLTNNFKNGFPIQNLIESFKGTTKTITFSDDDIENLFSFNYGQRHTFPILALLYPTLDYSNRFHQDHIFPRSWFKKRELTAKNIPVDKHSYYLDSCDSVANLQLLEGLKNEEKLNKDFEEWLSETCSSGNDRNEYFKRHFIPEGISLEFNNFETFINERKVLLRKKFKQVLRF